MGTDTQKSHSEILNGLLEKLQGSRAEEHLEAISTLQTLSYGSIAILRRLEWLTINDSDKEVREAASNLLDTAVYLNIFVRLAVLDKSH